VSATAPGVGTATFTGSIEAIGTPPDTTGGGGGGGGGGGNNPIPVTSSIAPNAATAGAAGFTLTVNGSNFVASSTVLWDGAIRTTTFLSAAQIQAAIPASDVAGPGPASAQVTVFNPAPGGGTSNAQTFTINP
jgi:hypothetical protein